jgi:hypothetical protein
MTRLPANSPSLLMSTPPDAIRTRIREIFLSDWDPSDASRSEYAANLYDRYIDPVWPLIQQGNEDAIVEYLRACELESMCTIGLGTARLRPPARKLLALRACE